jgi:hypothetical protein
VNAACDACQAESVGELRQEQAEVIAEAINEYIECSNGSIDSSDDDDQAYIEHYCNENATIEKIISGEVEVVFSDGELDFDGWFIRDAAIVDERSASASICGSYPMLAGRNISFVRYGATDDKQNKPLESISSSNKRKKNKKKQRDK